VGKITIGQFGKIEKTHPHQGFRKKAHGKRCPVKITSVKLAVRKIRPFKMEARGIEILNNFPLSDICGDPGRFLCGIRRMDGADV
jgi:hypothetical protein